jgi:hypothetical protein
MSRQFDVRASREEGWWFLEVDGVEGGFSQARRLDQVDATVRDLLALLLDIPAGEIELRVHVDWPDELAQASVRATRARKDADVARDAATAEMRRAATAAVAAGFTVRDVAELLDVSPQRISQLRIAERTAEYRTSSRRPTEKRTPAS